MVINLSVDHQPGQLRGEPDIITRGFILSEEFDPLADNLQKEVKNAVRQSNGNLENQVLRTVKSFLYQETKRNPFIFVNINES
jgi:mRNA degradation ribonuclease J1/J2